MDKSIAGLLNAIEREQDNIEYDWSITTIIYRLQVFCSIPGHDVSERDLNSMRYKCFYCGALLEKVRRY